MKKIIPILIIILLATLVFAEVPTPEQIFTEEEMLRQIQNEYNQQRHNAPPFIINLFGDERINVYMNGYTAYLITVDGEMIDVSTGELQDQTMNVYVSKETVQKIMNEELEMKDALDKSLIKYQGVGAGKKVKFGAVKMLYRVYSWFT
ncbi:MAG: hypothetical protein KAT77_02940 [Nanoarchaeota archaeon]|nr:hypothetical protein [Nanoarchaeota archaeon]